MDRRNFIKVIGAGTAAMITPAMANDGDIVTRHKSLDSLKEVDKKFSFVIFADPQVGHINDCGSTASNARRSMIGAIQEVNAMDPIPEFSIFLGDLVNVPDRPSYDNIVDCIKDAKMPQIWVHGNHDGRPPYEIYNEYKKRETGNDKMFFSWDIGQWHMIVLPCNLDKGNQAEIETENAMIEWLEKDLEQNKDRPTMVFEHLHIVPLGLAAIEWYAFRLELRMKLLDLFTRYGNVKWHFNGHIHCGIKAASKMAKTYKGINLVTCPTIIEGRSFAEEYAIYEHALLIGGYYLVVKVDGDNVSVNGKLVNVDKFYEFPKEFSEFNEEDEPRWFKKIVDFEPNELLINGDFEEGFNGWNKALRYISDEYPRFLWDIGTRYKRNGTQCAYLQAMAREGKFWSGDENLPVYQVVKAPGEGKAILKASYYLEQRPENAGGYIRISAISGNQFKFLMMFHIAENENRADTLPRCFGYEIFGEQQNWAFLSDLGKKRQAMFWYINNDPDRWHDIVVDLSDMYDRCIGRMGAFDELGITKYHISLGVWANQEAGSKCGMYFDGISLSGSNEKVKSVESSRDLYVNEHVFQTRFGQNLTDDVIRWDMDAKGRPVINAPAGKIVI